MRFDSQLSRMYCPMFSTGLSLGDFWRQRHQRDVVGHGEFVEEMPAGLIEQLFAKLKHHLRQAQARSRDAVCHAIAKVLETVTAPECSNDFAHAGYELT